MDSGKIVKIKSVKNTFGNNIVPEEIDLKRHYVVEKTLQKKAFEDGKFPVLLYGNSYHWHEDDLEVIKI